MPSPLLLGFLFTLNFVASVVLGVMAFGDVPLLHLVWQVTHQLLEGELVDTELDAALIQAYPSDVMFVTIVSSLRNLLILPYLAWLARDGFQPQLFTAVTLCSSLTVAIGVELLARVDATVLKPYVMYVLIGTASVLGAMSLRKLAKQPIDSSKDDDRGKLGPAATVVTTGIIVGAAASALISGIGTGLIGIGGPPVLFFILYQQLPPQMVRGTYPAASCVVAVVRASYTAYRGQYHAVLWRYYAASCVGGLIGIGVGNMFGAKLEQWVFNVGVVCILFMTGVSMSVVTIEKLTAALSVVFLYIAFAIQLVKAAAARRTGFAV